MYSFSIRQFIWEYIGGFFGGKFPYVFVFNEAIHLRIHRWLFWGGGSSLMYSFSIRQFIWEYIGGFFFRVGKVPLCIRFQLGNSFGNT